MELKEIKNNPLKDFKIPTEPEEPIEEDMNNELPV
jgi:hypothetical protein